MKTNAMTISMSLQAFFLAMVVSLFTLVSIPTAEAGVTHAGDWTKKQYKIKGDWEIDTNAGQTIIRFNNKFKTKNGPDLKIFLSKNSIKDVTGKNATEDAVMVAVLKSNKGSQEYVLPANINIEDYDSLLIHCEAYSVLWGGADIGGVNS